ncbi:UvrD-helicase domain-containing protein [Agromyces sp. SYSU T0242]|uniref:UvrD-helicase domain-containing protein n=1 Tax=Agromyces litoreus TaxID=3158561 RepID=UPI00339A0E35
MTARPIGADAIAARLGLHAPTPEQRAVIEADPAGRSIVVAGAGSGKTETMANRVVWLLANGLADVPEVLGLTFTRKAAGELADRVRERVGQLVAEGIADVRLDPLESAAVSTYNAFAGAIYREHALRIGREPDASILGEASAWQLARSIVAAAADPRLVELDASLDRVTGAVLALSRALAENVTDTRDVRAFAREFLAMHDLPIEAPRKRTPFESFTNALGVVEALPPLLELADAYAAEKQRRGMVEFSDQVALALQICIAHPEVVDEYRARHATVLLDEYQDTSVVQTRLLATLFRDHPVMAVGDPDQSIYGWRGASAANLARFGGDFSSDGGARAYDLSTSWRNPVVVLDAANALIGPLDGGIPKAPLRPSPFAGAGRLDVRWSETIDDEAAAVADWLAIRMRDGDRTGALLCRTFAHVDLYASALRACGVPVHVLGVAGLLDQPVIADLVCALRVLHDPTAGSELLRLLGGARWRIGPADLAALGAVARWLADRDLATRRLADDVRRGIRGSIAPDESPSIVDALDFVITAPDDHRALAGLTGEGRARMRRAGSQLQALRRRAGLGLVDFVTLVQQELLLDIEVAANPGQQLGAASLESFDDLLAGFVDTTEQPTLGAFLGWLGEAEQRDRLSPRQDEPEPGAVQVLSIHGSKGLEWDVVAIPRMVEGELPSRPRSNRGWLAFGALPDEFRGDRDEIPQLMWRGAQSQAEFDEAVRAYAEENRDRHAEEERRLAYVGVTRAKSELLLTGSWWATQRAPRAPSPFLRELVVAGLVDADRLPAAPEEPENPRSSEAERVSWPLDPLGARRPAVVRAADAVREAATMPSGAGLGPVLADELRMLLEERRRRGTSRHGAEVPTRVPASRFKDYVDDPAAVAADLARPMPQRPYRATRIGTLFHEWVEARSGGSAARPAGPTDSSTPLDLDAFADELDDAMTADEVVDAPVEARLERLRATFAASEWGTRRPVAVELELHLPLDGQVFVCKLDAVYDVEPDSDLGRRGIRAQVVDWKTGAAPRDERELELRQTQLALYRLAYARWSGVDVEAIDAVFYFVEDDLVLRPGELYDEAALRRAWAGVRARDAAVPIASVAPRGHGASIPEEVRVTIGDA